MSLNGRLGNSEIGGRKEIPDYPLTLRQPSANPSPTLRQRFANLFCQPLSKPHLSVGPRHPFRDTGERLLGISLFYLKTCTP